MSNNLRRAMRQLVFLLLVASGAAFGQPRSAGAEETLVTMTTMYMEHCTLIDEQLRATCSRIGTALPDRHKSKCDLPGTAFATKHADAYATFRQAHRAYIGDHRDALDKAQQKARRAFETRFADVRAGKVSMPDLESLAGELKDRCATLAGEWLRAGPAK